MTIQTEFRNVPSAIKRTLAGLIQPLGRMVDPSQSPQMLLRLSKKLAPRLDAQGFNLTWQPMGDVADMFDPSFRWHGDAVRQETRIRFKNPPNHGTIEAANEAGLLYGVLEFIERCEVREQLPIRPLEIQRQPSLQLRSACLQLMKRGRYILPITREHFPWFYDRAWWGRYLDILGKHRFNAVTLWNFHPFPYFCRIEGNDEVHELDDEELQANAAHLRWLIDQAKARGIQLLWHFYNIYVCPSYAKAHGLNTLYNRFTPQQEKHVFRYIRNCMRSFAAAFPDLGFVACVGEGVSSGKAERFVADVLVAALNETSHRPRLIVRQWSSLSADRFERHVVGRYESLWAMLKHNAEHIAGTTPDARLGSWVATGVPVVVNFHMLSEVGPYRWSPPRYIRELCLHYKALGASGVHVYPHWPWRTPAVGDLHFPGDELDRDWLYHAAWGRYSFDPVRDSDEEDRHWSRLAQRRGLAREAADVLIKAYDTSGPAIPRLQQNLWAYYDNHSVLIAGLTLGQLRLARSMHGRNIIRTDRLEDHSPLRGDLMEWSPDPGGFHFEQAVAKSVGELDSAIGGLEAASLAVHDEPARLLADLRCMRSAALYLGEKAKVADLIMRYSRCGELNLLREAAVRLQQTLDDYRAYRDHAEQRYEGVSDVPPYYPFYNYESVELPYTWSDCLEVFEREMWSLTSFLEAMELGRPWSLVHHYGFDRQDDRRILESSFVQSGGHWLKGDPDFLPWPQHLRHMKTLVLLPCATQPAAEISLLSDPGALAAWVKAGGHLVALTLPDRPWVESETISRVLNLEMTRLSPKVTECGGDRHLTIRADHDWNWVEQADGRGIHGFMALEQGRVEFLALSEASALASKTSALGTRFV